MTPIDAMIDAACRLHPIAPRPSITLHCPKCGADKKVDRHRTDPKRAVTAVFPCIDCGTGDYDEVCYQDADGKGLNPATGKPWKSVTRPW